MGEAHSDLTRREVLKRGAALGGAIAWATPLVQFVGMSPALADPVSPGCVRYALKWEVDENEPLVGEFTCAEVEGEPSHQVWSNTWTNLGKGGPPSEPEVVEETAEQRLEEATTTTDTTTPTSTTTTDTTTPPDTSTTTAGTTTPPDTTTTSDSIAPSGTAPSDAPGRSDDPGRPEGPEEAEPAGAQPQLVEPSLLQVSASHEPGGNCLTAPDDALDDESAAESLTSAEGMEFKVYGSPSDGFYLSFPNSCSLANLTGESSGEESVAAKCGSDGCNAFPIGHRDLEVEEDPCFEGYTRVRLEPCVNGADISHLELIIDCCG